MINIYQLYIYCILLPSHIFLYIKCNLTFKPLSVLLKAQPILLHPHLFYTVTPGRVGDYN